LAPVDEHTLIELVELAVRDAHPNEVTPPIGDGDGWTTSRVEWLLAFHRDRRAGLAGPLGEATWAVIGPAGGVAGSVRLQRTPDPGALETGIWLARGVRARGWAEAALRAVVDVARDHGAVEVRAETAATNAPALAVLRRLGFRCSPAEASSRISAVLAVAPT
jgi:RimJ/RimL family protein N-acetyltransferase